MPVSVKPSKIVFRRIFRRELVLSEPYSEILDFGCADGKFRPYFSDKRYLGADLQESMITKAQAKYHQDSSAKFVQENVTELKNLVERRFELVVSTHMFHDIPEIKKPLAAKNLVQLVKLGGDLIICTKAYDAGVLHALNSNFTQVKVQCFRGTISRLYEAFLERLFITETTNKVAQLPKLFKGFFYSISWILSFLDFIGQKDYMIISWRGKKG